MEIRKPKEITMMQQQWDAACDEVVRLRAELAEAHRHAKVLAKACCGLMNNGKPDCKDHELRDALIHVKGTP